MDRLRRQGEFGADLVVLARATPEPVGRAGASRGAMPAQAPCFRCDSDVEDSASGPPSRRTTSLRAAIELQSIQFVIGCHESRRPAGARTWTTALPKALDQAPATLQTMTFPANNPLPSAKQAASWDVRMPRGRLPWKAAPVGRFSKIREVVSMAPRKLRTPQDRKQAINRWRHGGNNENGRVKGSAAA
jgi:hypothetical protein